MINKIVVLGPLPPPFGGVSIHIIRYLELLKTTGWKTAAFSYTGTTSTNRAGKLWEILGMFTSIYLQVYPGTWDVLHLHYGGMGYFLGLGPLLKFSPGRKVITFHSVRVIKDLEGRPGWIRRWALSLLNSFDLFVVVREGIGDDLRELGLTKPEITVMPAFLPPSEGEAAEDHLPLELAAKIHKYRSDEVIQICCAAYYLGPGYGQEDLYGIEELLAVLEELDEDLEVPLALWILVSNGPESAERKGADAAVRRSASKLKNISVELHYGMPLVPVMARCQAFLRPSREDGDSVALREALGLGLASLASDVVARPEGAQTFDLGSRNDFGEKLKGFLGGLRIPEKNQTRSNIDTNRSPYEKFAAKVLGPGRSVNPVLKSTLIHLPIFLGLLVLVFACFGKLMSTPLWDPVDFQILADAHRLVEDPGAMFRHVGFYFSQPALQLAFLAEYHFFGIQPAGYIAVNLFIHSVSSFLVYMLVNLLFPRRNMAIVAAILFAVGVGSYGKIFMAAHQLESLLLAVLHLMVLYFFIRNDHRSGGGLRSPLFVLGIALFLLTGLTRNASFSLLGSLLAYKVFFHRGRGIRGIFSSDLLVLMGVAIAYYYAQGHWGYHRGAIFSEASTARYFNLLSLKTIFRYLTLMIFPMQNSRMMEDVPFYINWLWEARALIRTFLALTLISYGFFGFVFGSKAVRFFIAWTIISLLPFTALTETGGWLNLNHLYLTSLGFCVVLAAGANGTSGLLVRRRWRRFIPYGVPLAFVIISLGLTAKFNERNIDRARTPAVREMQEDLEILTEYPAVAGQWPSSARAHSRRARPANNQATDHRM